MRRFAILVVSAIALAGCSEKLDPTAQPVQHDIQMAGNTYGQRPDGSACTAIDDNTCFFVADSYVKKLYNNTSFLSYLGEIEYNSASGADYYLAMIFQTSVSLKQALGYLDKYIGAATPAPSGGGFSQCASAMLLPYAQWIRGVIATGTINGASSFANEPDIGYSQMIRCVSPLVSMTGTAGWGTPVQLTALDPYHYAFGTPYPAGTVDTKFVWSRQIVNVTGTTWYTVSDWQVLNPNDAFAIDQVPPTVLGTVRTFTDTNPAVAPNDSVYQYNYSVIQVDRETGLSSTPTTVSFTVYGGSVVPPDKTCLAHDNSNHDPVPNNNRNHDKCDKIPPGQAKK